MLIERGEEEREGGGEEEWRERVEGRRERGEEGEEGERGGGGGEEEGRPLSILSSALSLSGEEGEERRREKGEERRREIGEKRRREGRRGGKEGRR